MLNSNAKEAIGINRRQAVLSATAGVTAFTGAA